MLYLVFRISGERSLYIHPLRQILPRPRSLRSCSEPTRILKPKAHSIGMGLFYVEIENKRNALCKNREINSKLTDFSADF